MERWLQMAWVEAMVGVVRCLYWVERLAARRRHHGLRRDGAATRCDRRACKVRLLAEDGGEGGVVFELCGDFVA